MAELRDKDLWLEVFRSNEKVDFDELCQLSFGDEFALDVLTEIWP